jgi:hypothetical protein
VLERFHVLAHEGAVPGTTLLLGEAGMGREALAVELAALLICRGADGIACRCSSCDRVRRGIHPDLTVVDLDLDERTGKRKKEISIDQARAVADDVASFPFEGRRRVVVFVSAHTPPLNTHAASALLKTLEEPPPHSCFVLLASNPERVLPTVVSRSVQVRVPPPDHGELLELLAALHDLSPAQAEAHWRACAEDAVAALRLDPGDGVQPLLGLAELTREAVGGDPLACLRLAVRAKAGPEVTGVLARALLDEAGRRGGDDGERALHAAAAVLAAERRRAALHLDPESVTAGALLPLLAG